ncbi:MAG: hypothetical protein IJ188_09235 [Clostridia bacterium]|nr:hypothetical protein [Clostridia bacterium]
MKASSFARFQCGDAALQGLYEEALRQSRENLRSFGSHRVLVEGGGYEKIWLETQPMGGDMFALYDLEAAKNNTELFLRFQREDGRLPGSIRWDGEALIPEFNKYQGFCFPFHALNLYYLLGEDAAWLEMLADGLQRFDDCLWRTRSIQPDGLLRSFCVYDTGEDAALRYGDAPCWWTEDAPPEGYDVVPMASMDITSWSFASRDTLRQICLIQGDEASAEMWRRKAETVAKALRDQLWDDQRGALFDRDRQGRKIDILTHNPLRCMYWKSISPEMARRFVMEHLLNPSEFWTPFPLPSVAANDPAFRNAPENNWSGQPEGLTWQRVIFALENYGYHTLVSRLGEKLFHNLIAHGLVFAQQMDPFTGVPSLVDAQTHQPIPPSQANQAQRAYGPTLLAALGYLAHRWGVQPHLNEVWFSLGSGMPFRYEAGFRDQEFVAEAEGERAWIQVGSRRIWEGKPGVRIRTDIEGNLLGMDDIEGKADETSPVEQGSP